MDEADRMVHLGFEPDLNFILDQLPAETMAGEESGDMMVADDSRKHRHDDHAMDIDGDDEDRSDDNGDKPTKPSLPKPEAGTTLFIRNLPFEATEDELRVL